MKRSPRPMAIHCRSSLARARSPGIPVIGRRAFSPTIPSNAAMAGFLSARSAAQSTIGSRECSKDAAAVNAEKGRELDRRLRDYCAAHTALEVETAMNAAQIGCARVFNVRDQYNDEHYAARDMTVPVLDRQSGVPIRVFGVVPKMSLTT